MLPRLAVQRHLHLPAPGVVPTRELLRNHRHRVRAAAAIGEAVHEQRRPGHHGHDVDLVGTALARDAELLLGGAAAPSPRRERASRSSVSPSSPSDRSGDGLAGSLSARATAPRRARRPRPSPQPATRGAPCASPAPRSRAHLQRISRPRSWIDHPHVRGDNVHITVTRTFTPTVTQSRIHSHVRGDNVRRGAVHPALGRFTPTCVGTTRLSDPRTRTHPHVRGDNRTSTLAWADGSPPRAWGQLW